MVSDTFVSIKNVRLRIRHLHFKKVNNDTPTLIFLHDALGCIESWKSFPHQLVEALQLNAVLIDRVGHGQSEPSKTKRPLDYLEKEAWEILPEIFYELKITKPIFLGCSDGASIALLYAAKFINPIAVISIAAHIKVESKTTKGIKATIKKLEHPKAIKKLNQLHGSKTMDLIKGWASIWLSPNFSMWNITKHLPHINCRTLVLQGTNDEYATRQQAIDIANVIGNNATCKLIVDCGHFPHLEKEGLMVKLVTDFMNSVLGS